LFAGVDYSFKGIAQKPYRITGEAYYKAMKDVDPYDVDNVKIKYIGANNAKAYATGIEMRLFGELIKDAESWLSIGFMSTREDLDNDFYYQYKNASGEIIHPGSDDQVVTDSVRNEVRICTQANRQAHYDRLVPPRITWLTIKILRFT
jgi:hypothetical protein